MNKYEDFIAGMEASRNSACEDYFSARPMLYVTREKEKIFDAGFEAAYKQQAETIERYEEHIKVLADYSESPNATGDRAVTEANRMLVLLYNRNKQTRGR